MILKKAVFSQLYAYFNENYLLFHSQYGYRAEHSTELAAIEIVEKKLEAFIDECIDECPLAIFMDLFFSF